jgi:type VI secretion system protein ImpA
MDSESFAPDLPRLLEPAAADAPCGPSVRYEPAFLALRQSREEDDASLPMGEWERPLKRADWRAVARDCVELLARSKDFQLAAWLCDAWLRQHQIRGFNAGAELIAGLVERYWECAHPRIEDGDSDARVAPFVWINESLSVALRLHVPLVFIADRRPPYLNLSEWERAVTPQTGRAAKDKEPEFTREQLIAMVDSAGVRWLRQLKDELGEAQLRCEALAKALDGHLAAEAPSLGKVSDALRRLERGCDSLLNGRGEPQPAAAPAESFTLPAAMPDEEPTMSAEPAASRSEAPLPSGAISSRQEAYRVLEAAAAYLQRTEPHSPTPYLVRRAVAWGQLSLPDLMQEVLREEGDVGRFFSMLGVNGPRD